MTPIRSVHLAGDGLIIAVGDAGRVIEELTFGAGIVSKNDLLMWAVKACGKGYDLTGTPFLTPMGVLVIEQKGESAYFKKVKLEDRNG